MFRRPEEEQYICVKCKHVVSAYYMLMEDKCPRCKGKLRIAKEEERVIMGTYFKKEVT